MKHFERGLWTVLFVGIIERIGAHLFTVAWPHEESQIPNSAYRSLDREVSRPKLFADPRRFMVEKGISPDCRRYQKVQSDLHIVTVIIFCVTKVDNTASKEC